MESLKKNWYLILIGLATIALGIITVITAVKLYQAGKQPVAPTAPSSKPKAATPACNLAFNIIAEITPTPTPTPTPSPTPTPTPTATPTPTPTEVLSCTDLTGTPDPSGFSPEDKIALSCTGTSDPDPINHFEFRVSIDSGTPTSLPNAPATKTDSQYKGEITYTIPDYGCYKIECRACTSTNSSNCTVWGQAGKTLAAKCAKEGEVCYGFAGLSCCEGLNCLTEGGLPIQPDKGGICQQL